MQIFETKYEISNLEEFDKKINYVIFSGIGNPKNFLKTLKENNLNISKEFIFPDHHNYTDNDLGNIINYSKTNNLKIITTEKDYLKISEKFQKEIYFFMYQMKLLEDRILKI